MGSDLGGRWGRCGRGFSFLHGGRVAVECAGGEGVGGGGSGGLMGGGGGGWAGGSGQEAGSTALRRERRCRRCGRWIGNAASVVLTRAEHTEHSGKGPSNSRRAGRGR